MFKIITLIISFLNKINKIIWKIIIFFSNYIKVEKIKEQKERPAKEEYRLFKVDEPPIIKPFIKLEKKDHQQSIKRRK